MTTLRTHRQLTRRPYQVFGRYHGVVYMLRRGTRAGSCPEIWRRVSEGQRTGCVIEIASELYEPVAGPLVGVALSQLSRDHGSSVYETWKRLAVKGTSKGRV